MQQNGESGTLLDWICDYLTDRKQRVIINGQNSPWGSINAGVPQGSILGPLLFLIYINDITHVVNHCQIRLFADDTCLYITVDENHNLTANLINEDIASVATWASKWLVKFSPQKTEAMVKSNRSNKNDHPRCTFNNNLINETLQHMHLGVIFSSDLTWSAHIDSICKKANKRLGLLKSLQYRTDRHSLERLYIACILPVIEYADVIWAGSYEKDLEKLDSIHHKGARIVSGATERCSTNRLMEEVGWNSLLDRRRAHRLTLFYKIVNGKSPPYLQKLLPQQRGQNVAYSLRATKNYNIMYARLRHYTNSFIPHTVKEWNILDESMKHFPTLEQFKKKIMPKKVINKNYYYGARQENISLSRTRVGCSKLNGDLCNNLHVIESPLCKCGHANENALHFFFHCHLYNHQRVIMLEKVSQITRVSLQILLHGRSVINDEENSKIMEAVHEYIKNTKRFI